MNKEDYFKYYIQGSDHYLIPKDVFDELFNEMENWKQDYKRMRDNFHVKVDILEKLKNQQKEFMNFLTEAINKLKLEQETSNSAILKANIDLQVEVYSIVLSKYKEIIGDDK